MLYQILLYLFPFYQFPFSGYTNFRYIWFRYISVRYIKFRYIRIRYINFRYIKIPPADSTWCMNSAWTLRGSQDAVSRNPTNEYKWLCLAMMVEF